MQVVDHLGLPELARLCATCRDLREGVRAVSPDAWLDLRALSTVQRSLDDVDRGCARRFRHRSDERRSRIRTEAMVEWCAAQGRVRAVGCLVGLRERARKPARTLRALGEDPRGWKADASLWTWAVRGAACAGLADDVMHYKCQATAERFDVDRRRHRATGNQLFFKGMADLYASCKGYAIGGHAALLWEEMCAAYEADLFRMPQNLLSSLLVRLFRAEPSGVRTLMRLSKESPCLLTSFLHSAVGELELISWICTRACAGL